MTFSIQIKDYNTFAPLSNKQIQLTNIDSKQTYTQITDSRGYASFSVKESERGDFFSIKLLNDSEYEQTPYYLTKQTNHTSRKITTKSTNHNAQQTHDSNATHKYTMQKILNPNSYANHPAILYFKAKVSLYFNGTTLYIMQGRENLVCFSARSGKALKKEEKLELERQGYEGFVSATNSDNNLSYFCLDKHWQKDKKGAIPEGEYYINPSEPSELCKGASTKENNSCNNIRIYTDMACTITRESTTQRDDFYLCKKDEFNNAFGIDVASDDASSDGDFFSTLKFRLDPAQEVVKLKVAYPKKLESSMDFIYMIDGELKRDKEYLHANTIFAPGTYIELQTIADITQTSSKAQTLQWAFTIFYNQREVDSFFTQETWHAYTFHPLLDDRQKAQQEHNVRIFYKNKHVDTTGLGFSLPLIREYENSPQCFIIVFAFDYTKTKPDVTDPYKIINMSFRVGKDSKRSVMESKREKQSLKQRILYDKTSMNNIKVWNDLECICSVKEALEFLQANSKKLNELYQSNQARYLQKDSNGILLYDLWFDYYRIYPSLAGKIAYIYYRFDVGDEVFVKSVGEDRGKYRGDRDKFIETITQVYVGISPSNSQNNANRRNYKKEFEDGFLHNKMTKIQKEQLIRDFINDMGKALKIEQKFIPQVKYNPKRGNAGTYNDNTNTLNLKLLQSYNKDDFIDLLDTIIHEFRHFYIYYVFENAKEYELKQSHLAQLVYYGLYISWEHEILFNVYDKECASFDAEIRQCTIGQTYLQHSPTSSPLYFIQPSERDCRVVAGAFRDKVGL